MKACRIARQQPLKLMGFRFRRRIGPKGLKINLTKNGFSSVSIGGKGLTANVPINRKGGIKYTAGIPGSGLSWEHQEKDRRGETFDASENPVHISPRLANAMAIGVIVLPILLIWGCVSSVQQSAKEEAQRKAEQAEIARQAASKRAAEEWAVMRQLVVSYPRWVSALPSGRGLAIAKFAVTNNSERTVCSVGARIYYTTPSGNTQMNNRGGSAVDGNPCLGPGQTLTAEVMLTNRGLSGLRVGIPPKVTLTRPQGGIF